MTKRFERSIKAALSGFRHVLVFELNFKIMFIVAIFVVGLMLYFPTSRTEKALLLVMIFAVLVLELVNSVIERIIDFVHIGHHEKIREIKDLMASIVLVVVFASASIGVLVFWPYVKLQLGF
jgi:diacylglycerol kinase